MSSINKLSILFLTSLMLFSALACETKTQVEDIKVVGGTLDRITSFPSKYVRSRNVDIWLPANYSTDKKYSVLYMHDGQMLYDASTTWNGQAWDVDDTISQLVSENEIKETIVVGIWNADEDRHADYFPQKPFELLSEAQKDTISAQLARVGRLEGAFQPKSDAYLKFLVEELKPFIDEKYAVYREPEHTFIAGSSMGGLISLYAITEYPEVFGGAACLSTHWVGTFTLDHNPIPDAFLEYFANNLPDANTNKIYFDTGDQTLDALYPPIQQKMDSIMTLQGFTSENWITNYFPGDDHSEKSWSKRLSIPLIFLLGND